MSLKRNLCHLISLNSIDWYDFAKKLGAFFIDYHCAADYSRSLLNITMELTHNCNLKCSACFIDKSIARINSPELNLEEIRQIVASAAKMKASFFLTGGEPFLREDIIEIIKIIKGYKLKCGVNTNGVLLSENKINALIETGLSYIIFSVNGSEDVHDKMAGMSGAHNRAIDNLKNFAKHKSRTKIYINCLISEENINCLKDVLFLTKNIGIDGIRYQHLSFLTPNDIHDFLPIKQKFFQGDNLKLFYKEYQPFLFPKELLYEKTREVIELGKRNRVDVFFKPLLNQRGITNWYGESFRTTKKCFYPWYEMRIAPNGDVFSCPLMRIKMGNVLGSDIKQIFNDQKFKSFRARLKNENGYLPVCARCCKLYMSPIGRI